MLALACVLGACCLSLAVKGVQRLKASLEDRSGTLARRERERRERVQQHMRAVSQGFSHTDMENPMVGGAREPSQTRGGPWLCSLCTFCNRAHVSACVMCGASHGAWLWRGGPADQACRGNGRTESRLDSDRGSKCVGESPCRTECSAGHGSRSGSRPHAIDSRHALAAAEPGSTAAVAAHAAGDCCERGSRSVEAAHGQPQPAGVGA